MRPNGMNFHRAAVSTAAAVALPESHGCGQSVLQPYMAVSDTCMVFTAKLTCCFGACAERECYECDQEGRRALEGLDVLQVLTMHHPNREKAMCMMLCSVQRGLHCNTSRSSCRGCYCLCCRLLCCLCAYLSCCQGYC